MSRENAMFRLLVEYGDLAVRADAHRTKHHAAIDDYLAMVERMNEIRCHFDAYEKYRLSERETQVLQGLAEGLTNEQIGARLYISPETVRTHVRKTLDRLGVNTRTRAVAIATKHGIVDPEPAPRNGKHVQDLSELTAHARRHQPATDRVLKAV